MTTRQTVADIARSWKLTPFRDGARLKGIGADCTFIAKVYEEAGLVPAVSIGTYSSQFGQHRDEETYLAEIIKHAHEVSEPLVGDVVMFKLGRTFSHSAIVVDPGWPRIVHANNGARYVVEDDADQPRLQKAPRRYFSMFR